MHSESFRQLERKMSTDDLRVVDEVSSKRTLLKDRRAGSHACILEKGFQRYHSQYHNIQISNFNFNTLKDKIISASPASNFVSAKDKASVHCNIIDSKRNIVCKNINPHRSIYKVDLDDASHNKQKQARFQENEDKLILEKLNRRKRVLFEDSEMSFDLTEPTVDSKRLKHNRYHKNNPSGDMNHHKKNQKEWNRIGNYENFNSLQGKIYSVYII